MSYQVGDHMINDCALDYSFFPAGFHVICEKCKKIMLNHDVLKTPCDKEKKDE